MTTATDTEFLAFALDLINDEGTNMAFTTPATGSDYSRTTGTVTDPANSPITRKATAPINFEHGYQNGKLVTNGSATIFVAASGLTFTPVVNHKVVHDSRTWRVTKVKEHRANDDIVVWELEIKR